VVNGAYPGGESCRLANIAWQQTGGAPAVHNIRNFAVPPRPVLALYENWIDRRLEASVHAYIGVSRCCAESLRLRPVLSASQKIRHVYNGVALSPDEERAPVDLRATLGIGDAPLCLMLATYESRKGHKFLFESFRRVHERFPQAHLVICGDGTEFERAEVERLRMCLAPQANIHLLKFIRNGSKLIWQADMLIVASQEWESFGWTVIEAMARGVPVVSTNAGGLSEVVGPNGVAGFAVDPQDVQRFVACIGELISKPDRRAEMGVAGLRRVAEHFAVERMAAEYAKIVRSPAGED
jgi:glycosyltransferase involved in cell wall biosynthesis